MDGIPPPGAAQREAWEEAGVKGRMATACVGIYSYTKLLEDRDSDLPCVVAVFPDARPEGARPLSRAQRAPPQVAVTDEGRGAGGRGRAGRDDPRLPAPALFRMTDASR